MRSIERSPLTRRRCLWALGSLVMAPAAAALLQACGGAAPPTATPAPPAKPTSPPAPATTAPAPAATAAPTAAAKAPAATTAPAPAATTAPAPTAAAKVPTGPVRLEYWAENRFSGSHKVSVEEAKAWATANKAEVVTTELSSADWDQKVSAAIEANTLPDMMDMGELLVQRLTNLDRLVDVSEPYTRIGAAQGGWLKGIELTMDPKRYKAGKGYWAIPRSSSGNLLNWRQDILEKAGLQPPPKTWFEMADMAAKAQKPGQYWGLAISLAQEGDGNATITLMQTFGTRVADDAGKQVTLNSPATVEFLKWIDDCYTARKLFPPGVVTWDGSGDNNSYQSGQAIFVLNPGSVYRWMNQNDKELLANTRFGALPAGPKLRLSPMGLALRGVFASSKQREAAFKLTEHLTSPDVMSKWFKVDNNGPVLAGQKTMEAFKDPFLGALVEVAENGSPGAYPDAANPAWSEFNSQFVVPKMIQRVVVDRWTPEQAVEEAHKVTAEIYAKHTK